MQVPQVPKVPGMKFTRAGQAYVFGASLDEAGKPREFGIWDHRSLAQNPIGAPMERFPASEGQEAAWARFRQLEPGFIADLTGKSAVPIERIEIMAGLPGTPYRALGKVKARASAPTAFNRAPTLDEVNGRLREQASRLGANAIISVAYNRGADLLSWKAIHAEGLAVFLESDDRNCPYCAETIKRAAVKCRYCGSDVSSP